MFSGNKINSREESRDGRRRRPDHLLTVNPAVPRIVRLVVAVIVDIRIRGKIEVLEPVFSIAGE
jgi:hypothetical protein